MQRGLQLASSRIACHFKPSLLCSRQTPILIESPATKMHTDRRGAAYPLTHDLGWRQHFAHTSEPPEGKKMRLTDRLLVRISLAVLVVMISMTMPARAPAQGP